MVDVARFFLEFIQDESCGKCAPCRVGTKRMLEILDAHLRGRGRRGRHRAPHRPRRDDQGPSLCGLGQTAPNPVLSHDPPLPPRVRGAHPRQALRGRRLRDAGQGPLLQRLPGQRRHPRLRHPGRREALRRGPRLHRERNPLAAICSPRLLPPLREQVPRAGLDAPVAIRGVKRFMVEQESDDPAARGPRERRERHAQGRHRRRRPGRPLRAPTSSPGWATSRRSSRPSRGRAACSCRPSRPTACRARSRPRDPHDRGAWASTLRDGKALGEDFTLKSLRDEGYEAVFLGVGAPQGAGIGMPGEDAEGITDASPSSRTYNVDGSVPVGKNVVVIGGGNSAIDAARTALRLGAESVTILYRRTRAQMPAWAEEIDDAEHEGIELMPLVAPVEIVRDADGKRDRRASASRWRWATSTAAAAAARRPAATPTSSSRPTRSSWPSARRSTAQPLFDGIAVETDQAGLAHRPTRHRPDLGQLDLRRRRRRHGSVVGRRGRRRRREGGRRHRRAT